MKLKILVLTFSLIILGSLGVLDAQDDTLSAYNVKWSPDGRWIAANTSSGVWVFDAENPDAEPSIYYEGKYVWLIAFNPIKSELAVIIREPSEYAYKNGIVNLDTGESSEAQLMPIGGINSALSPISLMSSIYELSYTADGAYLIMAMDSQIFFYEPSFHRVDFSQVATEVGNITVSVSQIGDTGNFLALNWAESDRLVIVNREAGLLSSHQPEHIGDVVYYLDDTRAVLPSSEGIYFFDFGSDEEWLVLDATEITASAFFAPGKTLVFGGYGFVEVVNVLTFEVRLYVEIQSEQEYMSLVAFDFNPDGSQFVSLRSDGILSIWDLETGESLHSWQAFENASSIKWG